eukprot:gene17023-23313_t
MASKAHRTWALPPELCGIWQVSCSANHSLTGQLRMANIPLMKGTLELED